MTAREYKSLGIAERRVFFIAALVPVDIRKEADEDGTTRYAGFADLLGAESESERAEVLAAVASLEGKGMLKKGRPSVRTTRETLAVIAQEADKRRWWPSRVALTKSYAKIYRRWGFAERVEDSVVFSEQMIGSWRFLATGDDCCAGRMSDTPGLAAIQASVELLADDLDPVKMAECLGEEDCAALICGWLECAFWQGRDVRRVLEVLGKSLDDGSLSQLTGNPGVVQAYAALCVWTGWHGGLSRSFAAADAFCRGCKAVLEGNLPLAYKLMDPLRKKGELKGTLPRFLLYLVCRVVVPDKSRVLQKVLESRCIGSIVTNKYLHAATSAALSLACPGGYVIAETPDFDDLRSVVFTALAVSRQGANRVRFCRKNARRMADAVRGILESGYVNVCGVVLSLLPELGAEENAAPVMQAMEEHGTWILPYKAGTVRPLWERFVSTLASETRSLLDEDEQSDGEVAAPGRITWELECKRADDGWLSVFMIHPYCWRKRYDGQLEREYMQIENVLADSGKGNQKDGDVRLATLILTRDLDGRWYRGKRGVPDTLAQLCGMDNVELVIVEEEGTRFGKVVERRGVRIRECRCDMQTTAAEDGSVTIQMPEWQMVDRGYQSCGYVLRETDRADELVFMKVDPVVGEVAKLLDLYGTNGVIQIPREGVEREMRMFGRLSKLASPDVPDRKGEDEVPEVKADAACFVRLDFGDGALEAHAYTRPVAGNHNLAFEPGFGAKSCVISGENGPFRLVRDFEAEKAAFRPVEEAMSDIEAWFEGRCSWRIHGLGEAVAAVESLKKLSPAVEMEWRKGRRLRVSRPRFRLESSGERNGWFSVRGTFMLEDGRVMDVMKLLDAMKTGGDGSGYVRLDDGDYVKLTKEMQRQFAALASAGREKDGSYEIPRGAIPMLQAAFGGEGVELPAAMAKAAEAVREALESDPEPPRTLQAQLRPYQLEGYKWLSRLASCGFGACLADDMGLGKTVQIITLLLERAKDGPSLVVAPASVCGNWRNEIRRFAPTLEPVMAIEDEEGIAKAGPRSVVLASYGYLLFHEKEFAKKPWNGLVLDEAQAIKNESAKRTKAVKGFKAKFRVAATGTPVENRLMELWSIFDFLNTGLLGTAGDFESSSREGIKRLVKPLILRRLKGDVLDDLPPKTEVARFVELGQKERAGYEACRLKALEDVAQADKSHKLAMLLTGLTRLRRYCCNPSLVAGGKGLASAKLDALAELMAELRDGGHRALVFSQFTDYLDIVRKMVEGKGWSMQYLDGTTPLKERGRRVDAFQNGDGDFFLISLKAGGTGLNLTAADYVIILDPWWNPAVENQAADRAHRIGQRRPVTIYRLIAKDTVEEQVLALHNTKRLLAADILDDTGSSSLSSEMLMSLLKGE